MMIYIYRRAASEGATLLAEDITLLGTRARRTQGQMLRQNIQPGDAVVCWGDALPEDLRVRPNQIKVLNNVAPLSKYQEAVRLREAGVSTVEVALQRPAPRVVARAPFAVDRYAILPGNYTALELAGVIAQAQEFIRREQTRRAAYDAQPAPVADNSIWLARRNNHVGGSDLLGIRPGGAGDYYSKKETLVEEFRLHMFDGKSIRAGVKRVRPEGRPNTGGAAHEWIRSYDAGWIIAYEGFQSTKAQRELAASALTALGLNFGAVDIGRKADGSLIVLEVNRAPGVEGGTAAAYANKIIAWARG